MADIHDLTALELAAAVRSGELGPVEVTEHTLSRARDVGARVGAFVTLTEDLARDQARQAEERLREHRQDASRDLPPLLGVPCPIKDLTMVAGVPFGAGSAALRDFVAPVDDGVVTLLRRAGAVIPGKTTTPELGLPAYTEPDVAPPARTPWDLSRSAGGSSGGAAAAVAAGVAPVAQGNDGGGSLRIPASACGLVGLKPTRGRISPGPHRADGLGLATEGVVTRDVRDTAALLDVLAQPWPGDHYRLPAPATTFRDACDRPERGLRVGLLTEPVVVPGAPVHPEALRAVERTAALLEDMGHHVVPAPVPFPAERWDLFMPLWSVLALSAPVPAEAEEALVPLTRWLRGLGREVTGLRLLEAISGVQQLTREVADRWAGLDLILSPTLAQPPAVLGSLRNDADPAQDFEDQKAYTPWGSVWNIIGAPVVSLPLHWGVAEPDGPVLPFGVMLGGRSGGEETLLSVAAALEEAAPWRGRRPPVW